jgi:uncharacterized protein
MGLIANITLGLWQVREGFAGYPMLLSHILFSMPFDIAMAIGYAALVMAWVQSWGASALLDRIAAVGRMAFTNYIMTSIIMTSIFYGYGLGLTGHLERAELFLVMLGMWALMLAWSKPWLERYNYGPFEWLWRSLSRLKLQKMRKGVERPVAIASA